jgi:hypothetical protein
MIVQKHLKASKTLRLLALCMLCTIFVIGCKKYQDPPPTVTDKLTTPYCNIPTAVNYNWGFPGIATNSVCIYPAQLFVGTYTFYDSVLNANAEFEIFDTTIVTINKLTDSTLSIAGLCPSNTFSAKATKNFRFYLDSTNVFGQVFCTNADTINGSGIKQLFSDTNFKFSYNLINNAVVKEHKGTFVKQ